MKFHDYADITKNIPKEFLLSSVKDPLTCRHIIFENCWNDTNRPYYNIYPTIIPMLTALRLNMSGNFVKPPNGLRHLLLRLPDADHILRSGDIIVRTIFMSFQLCLKDTKDKLKVPNNLKMDPVGELTDDIAKYVSNGLTIGINTDEKINGCSVSLIRVFPTDDRLLEESVNALEVHESYHDGVLVPDKLIMDCVRLCLTVCLLDNNPELVSPDILNKDHDKYINADENTRQKLIDKAKRRGKFGFVLGKNLEVIPHVRRPHPALVWTGTGRKIPKIIMRSGSIVHRDKIYKVPTGYGNEL